MFMFCIECEAYVHVSSYTLQTKITGMLKKRNNYVKIHI
jgi:hypothetical protein